MQTKYYLTLEQVGIINRIPIKEEDPDMQGILDALIKMYRIIEEVAPEDPIDYEVLIDTIILRIDCLYIETVETYDGGLQEIRKQIPLGNTDQCVRNLLDIIKDKEGTEKAAQDLVKALQERWATEEKEGPIPPKYVDQFLTQVINLVWSKLKD
jgi:hypothetical protein